MNIEYRLINIKRHYAFTLAEVLIVLGIIGMIAQMTIPTLMNNVNRQVYVTQLKENYSQISQAVMMYMADEGVNNTNDTTWLNTGVGIDAGQFLDKYFKRTKDCGYAYPSSCFAASYKNLDGNYIDTTYFSGYSVITANDTSILMGASNFRMSPLSVVIDINGPKAPNVAGRDLFSFSIYFDGNVEDQRDPSSCASAVTNYNNGCLAKILNNGWKMDY